MKKILPILVLVIIGIALCIFLFVENPYSQNSGLQQIYSNGFITFNYTENFKQTTPHTVIGDADWVNIVNLMDNTTRIDVIRYKDINDPNKARELTQYSPDIDPYSKVISNTTEINPNGIEIFKSVTTVQGEDWTLMYIDFYFKDKKDIVYSIIIYDNESKSLKLNNIANIIFNSLNTK